MDLMFAAEQYAQAQAAAVAAAQYYANAANAAISAAGTPGNVLVTAQAPPPGFAGLMPQVSVGMPVLQGTQMLGPQFLGHQIPNLQPDHRNGDFDKDDRRDRRDRRGRSRDRDRRDRSRSPRYERRRDRSRDRDRSRSRERRRRERDRSPRRDRDRRDRTPDSDDDVKNFPPNNTIMVRGLAPHISENDIVQDIQDCGLVAKDIRLIRKKDTGASRGFAFVEFREIPEAEKWMDAKQVVRQAASAGVLMFKDQFRASMQYSLPRDGRPGEQPRLLRDWICSKCGVQNFRRRENCFKCQGAKSDVEFEGADEVSSHPTNTVLLRGLDALTTEDSVLNCLGKLTELPIKSIRIGRDSLTNTSRGICYVEMNSIVDAMFLHNQLLGEPPTIDDKLVSVSYFRTPTVGSQESSTKSAAANAALAAAQWSHQDKQQEAGTQYSEAEIEQMAEYSANLYAKTPEEKTSYLKYYRNYYRNGGDSQATSANQAKQGGEEESAAEKKANLGTVTVNGVEYQKYPTPDVSQYQYDETSGYYYDPISSLYYDSNSQYYFNSKTNQYMYWDADKQTYLPAPDADDKGKKEEKKDKVKTAKRIAKDMEKWAKTLNQRKEAAKSSAPPAEPKPSAIASVSSTPVAAVPSASMTSTEDIAFSLLQQKRDKVIPVEPKKMAVTKLDDAASPAAGLAGLAGYGSDSEGDDLNDEQLTDWSKLACLLCKRQFPSKEKLTKHNQLSDLHKQNLATLRSKSRSQSAGGPGAGIQYRDRAKERRQKYGEDDAPRPNRLKEKYLRAREEVESISTKKEGIGSDNIGNKMLQKMGWKEGLGLGKTNQGRTSIIEADRRTAQAGLGSSGVLRANPNDSYKDCVKRTMFQRYHDLN